MTSEPAPEAGVAEADVPQEDAARDRDISSATLGYLGAIVLGPVIPVGVYVFRAKRSAFLRYHAAAAVNLSLTAALYALCCLILGGLLMLDSITAALLVALPVAVAIWASMLKYLIRGIGAPAAARSTRCPTGSARAS